MRKKVRRKAKAKKVKKVKKDKKDNSFIKREVTKISIKATKKGYLVLTQFDIIDTEEEKYTGINIVSTKRIPSKDYQDAINWVRADLQLLRKNDKEGIKKGKG